MVSRIHSILPRLALATLPLFPIAMLLFYRSLTKAYAVPPGEDIFALVTGTWAWPPSDSNCLTDSHRIAFTPDHKVMTITAARPYKLDNGTLDSVAYYDILQVTRSSIRGAIRGETRRTDAGVPVVWDLVLKDRDRYTWHRTDWANGGHTAVLRRCQQASR
jgi:hypothetical protein